MQKRSTHDEITNKIVAQLEAGIVPWVRPWQGGGDAGEPRNAETGRAYNGINRILLWMERDACGYASNGWLTFNQAKKLGGHVRKGEKGTQVVLLKPILVNKKDKDGNETDETKRISLLRGYYVFNVSQIEGLPEKFYKASDEDRTEPCQDKEFLNWVKDTKAKVVHGGEVACYIPSKDVVRMPHAGAFNSPENYKATLLHELVHWTGHEKRLDRKLMTGRFGDEAYAAEELIAELGAAFLCSDLGVSGNLRHADYIGSWIKVLKNDSRAIFTAASKATAAANHLHELAGTKKVEPAAVEEAA